MPNNSTRRGWPAWLVAAGLIAGGLLAAHPSRSAPASPPVMTESGPVTGITDGDVTIYKGIPYAAAPSGSLRWRPPQPAVAWTGERQAKDFGSACPQTIIGNLNAEVGPTSEDCLFLNIWTRSTSRQKLPVMVWIHGGGHAIGSSSERFYDGAPFAKSGVILVSINYRLGRLGYFAHPLLIADAKARGEPFGSYGIMDQIAALKWVKRNIAAFGGDPEQVTVFGESGGARSVNWLVASPAAKGLFQRAISQSGRALEPLPAAESARHGHKPTSEADAAIAASWGQFKLADRLREVPMETITRPLNELVREGFTPFIDGQIITGDPGPIFAAGKQNKVPFLIGINNFEASLIQGNKPSLEQALLLAGADRDIAKAGYGGGKRDDALVVNELYQDIVYLTSARTLAADMARHGVPSYLYRFAYVPEVARKKVPGAAHGSEIPFVFNTGYKARMAALLSIRDRQMAKLVHDYWVAFAKTGDPNGGGRTNWPRYDAASDPWLEFAPEVRVTNGLRKPLLDLHERRIRASWTQE
jgi:para-nitrobenzyl esterase